MSMRKPVEKHGSRRRLHQRALSAALVFALAGCSMAPAYHRPTLDLPTSFATKDSLWQPASPRDQLPRDGWWTIYGDATLDQLEQQLNQSNPDLAAALARYDGALAYAGQLRSEFFPKVGVQANPSRQRQSDHRPLRGSTQPDFYDNYNTAFSASYEVDLWGRIRNEVSAGRAQAQAASADLANAKLSLQAELADMYLRLSGYDVQARILRDSISAYEQGLKLTQDRFAGGISSQLDVARATAQLDDARAQASEVAAQRALAEHAIAALVGRPAGTFPVATQAQNVSIPAIPLGLPSTLLERRPDIAAAERATYAANAQIGVARAAFFPSLSLDAGYGWQNAGNGSLLTAANRVWALGPLAALTLFDGGLRHQRELEAKARFDQASAQYRSAVLAAFQQVQDNLSLLDQLGREADQEEQAAAAAQQAQDIATNRYREGAVSFLEVVTAQTATLQAERNAEQVRTRRLQASVDLVRALGGGWDASALAQTPTHAKRGDASG